MMKVLIKVKEGEKVTVFHEDTGIGKTLIGTKDGVQIQ